MNTAYRHLLVALAALLGASLAAVPPAGAAPPVPATPAAPAASASCPELRDGVVVYADKAGQGACTPLPAGTERGFVRAHSIRVGPAAHATACVRHFDRVHCERAATGNLSTFRHDESVFVRVEERFDRRAACQPEPTEATLASGGSLFRSGPCLRLQRRAYRAPAEMGFADSTDPAAVQAGQRWLRASDEVQLRVGRLSRARLCGDAAGLTDCREVAPGGGTTLRGIRFLEVSAVAPAVAPPGSAASAATAAPAASAP